MEAKDTVMSDPKMIALIRGRPRAVADEALCKAQAEISFKVGIREVVEWIHKNHIMPVEWYDSWVGKLKEWGIE